MENNRYYNRNGNLLDTIDSAMYDDEENGMFDEMKREEGSRYLKGFKAGINYVTMILIEDGIHNNRDLEIPET